VAWVRVRVSAAGLAAAVFGISGCAAAGVAHDSVARGHVPQGHVPQGQVPQGQVAQAQVGRGQVPRGQLGPGVLAAAVPSVPSASVRLASAARASGARVSSQLVTVTAASYGATQAELTAYRRVDGHWQRVFGPWIAWIGRNGMAPPGAKREGDGRTPSGTFGFQFFFGVDPDPGVHFAYRRVHPYDVWDDDPSSPLYNEWVDDRYGDAGSDPEPMDVSAYDYGAVIAYNTARTPGLGSAIFLHINIGTPTAGCVTLPVGELLEILRWLNSAASPRIAMGVG
jgi:L,D-peptidoglycan transpeptidase YkuD (ErfK/YbiS/YcfS/YnhG family)